MSTLLVYPQVTIRDVHAQVQTLGLDVDEFLACAVPSVGGSSGERETDLVRCLHLPVEELERARIDPVWVAFCEKVQGGAVLAHRESPTWIGLARTARRIPEWRTARIIRPEGVRTLLACFEKPGWDFRYMPSDALGAQGTLAELLETLWERIRPTTGGHEFLGPAPEARALAVLATTLSAILSEEVAMRSDHRRGVRLVRPDVYERAVAGMGLGRCFQAVRRILELDHPDHLSLRTAWPTPEDPVRELAFLEYRGRRDSYLALNTPPLAKLR
jgi:hypothetical protein